MKNFKSNFMFLFNLLLLLTSPVMASGLGKVISNSAAKLVDRI